MATAGRLVSLLSTHVKSGRETAVSAFSPDGRLFAWLESPNLVMIAPWTPPSQDLENDQLWRPGLGPDEETMNVILPCSAGVITMTCADGSVFKRQAPVIATGLANGRIRLWCMATGKVLLSLLDHQQIVTTIQFGRSNDVHFLVSGSKDGTVKCWNLEDDGNLTKTLTLCKPHQHPTCSLWSPDVNRLAIGFSDHKVRIIDTRTWAEVTVLTGHRNVISSIDYSTDGALVLTASWDTTVRLWDSGTGKMLKKFKHVDPEPPLIFASGANGNSVRFVRFSKNASTFHSVCENGDIRFWRVGNPDHSEVVCSVKDAEPMTADRSPDGAYMLVSTRPGQLLTYRARMSVPDLVTLARCGTRRSLTSAELIDGLDLPETLRKFLRYDDLSN